MQECKHHTQTNSQKLPREKIRSTKEAMGCRKLSKMTRSHIRENLTQTLVSNLSYLSKVSVGWRHDTIDQNLQSAAHKGNRFQAIVLIWLNGHVAL